MSSQDVFKVDIIGLTLPSDKLLLALFSTCLFFCCSSISSAHMLISSSGILCWDDCDDVVTLSSSELSDVAKAYCFASCACSGCSETSTSSGGSIAG